jgi:hypothetical protein
MQCRKYQVESGGSAKGLEEIRRHGARLESLHQVKNGRVAVREGDTLGTRSQVLIDQLAALARQFLLDIAKQEPGQCPATDHSEVSSK